MTTEVIVKLDVDWAGTVWAVAHLDAEDKIRDMRDWCIINLDVDTWRITHCRQDTISILKRVFTFDRPEDATAFKMRYGAK